tara:strand:+ start:1271 stop:3049 length:1779 start_codon:yes stop_codon:yes gene_type:complete
MTQNKENLKERYFVISADKSFWPQNDKIIFAGKWCVNPYEQNVTKSINFKMLENKIYDFENLRSEIKYCDNIFEKLLDELTIQFNKVHQINWSKKSWRVLIALWLNRYIAIINDRLNLLIDANKKYNIKFKDINFKDDSLVSYDLESSSKKILDHEWNENLVRRLQSILNNKKFTFDYLDKLKIQNCEQKSYKFNKFHYKIINKFWNFFPLSNTNKFFLNKIYVGNFLTSLKLMIKLKEFPVKYFIDERPIYKNIDIEKRKKISIDLNTPDIKEKIIRFLLNESIPTLYIEGFNDLKNKAINADLPNNKTIFTCNCWRDTIFKYWIADQINNGNKLIYGQHGAGFGIFKDFLGEKYEYEISDRYLTWGHKDEKNKKVLASVDQSLINNSSINKTSKKQFLIIPAVFQYYYYRNEIYDPNNIFLEFEKIVIFVKNLKTNSKILFKAHPIEKKRKFSLEKLAKDQLKNIKFINPSEDLVKLIDESSLNVFFNLGTLFLKNLAQNKPSIFICDKTFLKKLTPDSFEHFKILIEQKIVFMDSIEASNFLNKLEDNIDDWWKNENLQTARRAFANIYAKKTSNSLDIFTNNISKPFK